MGSGFGMFTCNSRSINQRQYISSRCVRILSGACTEWVRYILNQLSYQFPSRNAKQSETSKPDVIHVIGLTWNAIKTCQILMRIDLKLKLCQLWLVSGMIWYGTIEFCVIAPDIHILSSNIRWLNGLFIKSTTMQSTNTHVATKRAVIIWLIWKLIWLHAQTHTYDPPHEFLPNSGVSFPAGK